MNLFLIGYRATGKTTIGELLARRLAWTFVDADAEIQNRAGKTIAAIFADRGETAFRDLESEVVAALANAQQVVAALGGGAVLREENRRAMEDRGRVVWLQARAETIDERIRQDPVSSSQRPDLTRAGGLNEIKQLLAQREPCYRQCADWAVDTEGKTPQQVAEEIFSRLDHDPTSAPTA